jgi:hypothetical protein
VDARKVRNGSCVSVSQIAVVPKQPSLTGMASGRGGAYHAGMKALKAILDRLDIVAAGAVGLAGALYGLDKPTTIALAVAAAGAVLGFRLLWRRRNGANDA